MSNRLRRCGALTLVFLVLVSVFLAPCAYALAGELTVVYVASKLVVAAVLTACGVVIVHGQEAVWSDLVDKVTTALNFGANLQTHMVGGVLYLQSEIVNQIVKAAQGQKAFNPAETKTQLVNGVTLPYYTLTRVDGGNTIWDYNASTLPYFTTVTLGPDSPAADIPLGEYAFMRFKPHIYGDDRYQLNLYAFGKSIDFANYSGTNTFSLGQLVAWSPNAVSPYIGVTFWRQPETYASMFGGSVGSLPVGSISADWPWTVTGTPASVDNDNVTLPLAWGAGATDVVIDGAATASYPLSIPATDVASVGAQTQAQAQTGAVSSDVIAASDAIQSAAAVQEAVQSNSIPAAIAQRFPFCIPFDLLAAFQGFSDLPRTAPTWTIKLGSRDTGFSEYVVDFSQFDQLAVISRWGLLIIFNVGLMLVTRKLIKW